MSIITLEILIIALLIITNGVFAMSETAIVSARRARLQQWKNEGNANARTALELASAPNRFLSTVQIGITLIGILAGAFGGATIARAIAERLGYIAWLEPYSRAIGLGLVVLGITYLSVVIGELVPKRIALNNPERIATAIAAPMRLLSILASPAVYLLSVSTEIVLRGLGIRSSNDSPVTEEEINILLEQGTRAGVFAEAEQDMVENVFRLDDWAVGTLMTPRPEIIWLDLDDPVEEIQCQIISSSHTYFPVAQGNLENVLGIIRAKDLLAGSLTSPSPDLQALVQPPLFVPEGTAVSHLVELFKEFRTGIALALNEYGGIEGLVTLNDVLEAIVGEVPAASELTEPQAVPREDGSWLLDGMLLLDEFKDIFHIEKLPNEERARYQTLGGFVMSQLGQIPRAGQHFEWDGLRFEVIDMDGRRVDKVLVMPR